MENQVLLLGGSCAAEAGKISNSHLEPMPTTVASSFNTFYENINLGGNHRDTANSRRDNIVSKLSKDFEIVESFASGSIPKFTALKDHADLDVIVALHYGKHIKDKTPTEVLESVRKSLSEWKTGGRKNGQAVTLYYTTWPTVDVVPVSRVQDSVGNITHYIVPNSNTDTWIASRPKVHADDIEKRSTTCGANFRRVIKMIKEWNRLHSRYLQSYHIEVLALKVFDSNLDDTGWQVFQFFDKARPLLNTSLWHDLGFADDYLSSNDRTEICKRFDTAIELSRSAWSLTYGTNNDPKAAITKWKQLFGERFPIYG